MVVIIIHFKSLILVTLSKLSSLLYKLSIFEIPLLYCSVGQLPHALTIQLIVFVHALVYCPVWVCHFSKTVQLVIFEDALEHLTFNRYRTCLSIQIMILEMPLAKLLLINIIAETVQLVQPILINHLARKRQLLILIMINNKCTSNFCYLVILWSIFYSNQFSNTLDPKIVLEFEFALFVEVIKIEFACFQILKEEVAIRGPLKESAKWLIKHLLNYIEFVLGTLLKIMLINAPILQFHLKHFIVVSLLLVQLAAVANEVNHQAEGEGVAIDEYLVIYHLQLVSPRKHGFECAARNLTQRRPSDVHVLLATDVQLNYGLKILYLHYPFLLSVPLFLFFSYYFSLLIHALPTLLQFLEELYFTLLNEIDLECDFLLKFNKFLFYLLASFLYAT